MKLCNLTATIALALLVGCASSVTTYSDPETGNVVTRLREECTQDGGPGVFCINAEKIEAEGLGRINFRYLGADWIGMRKVQAQFPDDARVYTLFQVPGSAVRRFRTPDGIVEQYTASFRLKDASADQSDLAQFFREGERREEEGTSTGCTIRLQGAGGQVDWTC